jgi:hypothetical protein
MRVLFYTAAAYAATIGSAIRLEQAEYDDDFAECDTYVLDTQDTAGMTDAAIDSEVVQMERELKQMQETQKKDADKAKDDAEKNKCLTNAKEQAKKIRADGDRKISEKERSIQELELKVVG